MAQNLSRRKYSAVVKFLTATMTDEKESKRTRFLAACRLDDLLARADQRADRALDKAHRREMAALEAKDAKAMAEAKAEAAAITGAHARGEMDGEGEDDAERIQEMFARVLGSPTDEAE